MDYKVVFSNLQSVLKAASSKCKVIDEKFPSKFFESDPKKITESYQKFLKSRVDGEGKIKNQGNFPVTTICERFEKGEYVAHSNAFYRLHHDIKLVCTLLIHFYPQGTRNYQMVDKFYKFATELLLRECYRYGVNLAEDIEDQNDDDKSSFCRQISHDFIKISVGYSVPYAESFYISLGDQDLFSSTSSKSLLDSRPVDPPNSSFIVNKIIPQVGDELAPKLGFVAANVSNIPDPTLPPSEMMTKFLHPNWYALPTTVWLEYGDFKSWAPSFNESGTVLDAGRRGTIWLEKIGYMKLWKSRNEHTVSQGRATSSEPEKPTEQAEEKHEAPAQGKGDMEIEGNQLPATTETVNEKSNGEARASEVEGKEQNQVSNSLAPVLPDSDSDPRKESVTQEVPSAVQDLNSSSENHNEAEAVKSVSNIKLENLYDWAPGNFIGDDEIQAAAVGNHQQLITKALLQLAVLKQKRIRARRGSNPSSEERNLYYKVQRLLREVILSKQISKVPQIAAKSFPVLQANYMGSIPVVRTIQTRKKKYKK